MITDLEIRLAWLWVVLAVVFLVVIGYQIANTPPRPPSVETIDV